MAAFIPYLFIYVFIHLLFCLHNRCWWYEETCDLLFEMGLKVGINNFSYE